MFEKEKQRHLALSADPAFRKCVMTYFEQSKLKQMEAHWIFTGSGFAVDEKTDTSSVAVAKFETQITSPSSA